MTSTDLAASSSSSPAPAPGGWEGIRDGFLAFLVSAGWSLLWVAVTVVRSDDLDRSRRVLFLVACPRTRRMGGYSRRIPRLPRIGGMESPLGRRDRRPIG